MRSVNATPTAFHAQVSCLQPLWKLVGLAVREVMNIEAVDLLLAKKV